MVAMAEVKNVHAAGDNGHGDGRNGALRPLRAAGRRAGAQRQAVAAGLDNSRNSQYPMFRRLLHEIRASMGIYDPPEGATHGVLAEFSDPGALYHAAQEVRKAGYRHFDVHSPFPIHGMDRAMGLGNSRVGAITAAGGATGLLTGIAMQWWIERVRLRDGTFRRKTVLRNRAFDAGHRSN
jgi:hypothetical protein